MAEDVAIKSSEDIEKQLTVGAFAWQNIKTLGLTFGGAAAGVGLAWAANKAGMATMLSKQTWAKKLLNIMSSPNVDAEGKLIVAAGKEIADAEKAVVGEMATVGLTAGGVGGFLTGSITSGYEHWVKGKREQLGVEKVTNDIDLVMKSRAEMENTLTDQHKVVTSMRERLESERGKLSPERIQEEKNSPAERTLL